MLSLTRRHLLRAASLGAGFQILPRAAQSASEDQRSLPPSIAALQSAAGQVRPISVSERQARIEKSQVLMRQHKVNAILLTSGSSLLYFTGARWGQSERFFATAITADGKSPCISP